MVELFSSTRELEELVLLPEEELDRHRDQAGGGRPGEGLHLGQGEQRLGGRLRHPGGGMVELFSSTRELEELVLLPEEELESLDQLLPLP